MAVLTDCAQLVKANSIQGENTCMFVLSATLPYRFLQTSKGSLLGKLSNIWQKKIAQIS